MTKQSLSAFVWILSLAILAGCSDGNGGGGDADAGDGIDVRPDAPDGETQDPVGDDGAENAGDPVEDAPEDPAAEDAEPDELPGTDVPIIGGCQIFPADNMWNTPVDTAPLHGQSDVYIASIGTDTPLHPDFGTVWDGYPIGIPYTIVPDDQAMVDVTFDYADESDPGPYPIPFDALIEGGPDSDGDRHVLIIRQGSCILYELYYAYPVTETSWTAGSGAIWHLNLNEMRPEGWTSADAAGLAILPGLVKWEEVFEDGEINHAVRVTLESIQGGYIHPATHTDGTCGDDPACPPMGLRLRLKSDYDISSFEEPIQVILRAFKRYGLVVADTGGDMYISGVHDMRWNDDQLGALSDVPASAFEAVYTGDIIPY
jgi:hypothetical protein